MHYGTQSDYRTFYDATDNREQPAPAVVAPVDRKLVFAVTALGAFMASLDLSIVNVAFPALERTFSGDSRATLAWVITGYSIVFGALLVVAGRTADRLGSRRVFFAGLGVFSLGSLLCGVAPSVALLVAGRLVQGLGAAALLPSSLALLLGAFPTERRSQVVALWGGIGALAVATGPSVGALLITGFGWRAAFFVNLPIGLVAWLVGRRVLERRSGSGSTAAPDYLGVVLLAGSLSALVLAISQGPDWGWTSPAVLASGGVAAVLMAAFLFRSAHHPEPVLDLRLFRSRSFTVANLATLLYAMGFFAMLLGNILFLTSVWGYSILLAGLAVTPGPLVVAVVAGSGGQAGGPDRLPTGAVGRLRRLRVGPRLVRAPCRCRPRLPRGVAPREPGRGPRDRAHLPGPERRRRLQPGGPAVRGGERRQPDRPPGRGALGVAVLVVVLGEPSSPAAALAAFHHLWWYAAIMAVSSGLVCLLLRSATSPLPVAEPAVAPTARWSGSPLPVPVADGHHDRICPTTAPTEPA